MIDYLAFKAFNIKYGARFLKRTIDELVKIPLTLSWKEKDKFAIDTEQGKLVIH
jgi:ATP-dependent Clp protease ATP-binding subunit ClpA